MAKVPQMFLLEISRVHGRNLGAHITLARMADTTNAMPCSGFSLEGRTGSTWQPVWQEPLRLDGNGPIYHLPGKMPQEGVLTPSVHSPHTATGTASTGTCGLLIHLDAAQQ